MKIPLKEKHGEYKTPGTYIAICNNTNWDGHYVKIFNFPEKDDNDFIIKNSEVHWATGESCSFTASWYFLNRIDFVACLEAVYPISIFNNENILCTKKWQNENPAQQPLLHRDGEVS